ncbi:MAG: hypothetical protein CMK09_12695 [Ponticaulis sp.]|nr:hypothetical protein [Ponticaulis sp.]|tara:strand:+ start:12610 stop:13320 length:711 start_codon:yes stop_codon:yes gene_type:complete
MSDTKHFSRENLIRAQSLAKQHHEPLWLGSRFLDAAFRRQVEAVLALDGELLRIASMVTEPAIGQIRYQWWLDQLDRVEQSPEAELPGDAFLLSLICLPDEKGGLIRHVRALIDAREGVFLSELDKAAGHERLFHVLLSVVKPEFSSGDLSHQLGSLYSLTDGASASSETLKALAEDLAHLPEDIWPIVCVFALIPEWARQRQTSPIRKRWIIWKSFVSGEKSLGKKLVRLARNWG